MRSLLIKIFVAFWSIILITIVIAVAVAQSYADRTRLSLQNFEAGDAVLEASEALRSNGRDGLTQWLRDLPGATGSLLYIVDEQGKDLLHRRLPTMIKISVRRFNERGQRTQRQRLDRPDVRPARPFSQLIGPDGDVYTMFVMPPQIVGTQWLAERGRAWLIGLALLVSGGVSYLLARGISRPIKRLRESANAIADGRLDTRVAASVSERSDELGLLANDFNRMANELQRAWQKQSELTRNVSHELRSPLARLRVALELVRRKTGELAELDRIETETERLDKLIGRILEYSRLDADQAGVITPIDLEDLVQSVIDDVRYEYRDLGNDARISFEVQNPGVINGNASSLRSCVENVLRNAMQHNMEDGDVQVRLGTDAGQIVISIEDQAGGVAEDELTKIFEPFYRSRTMRTEHSQRSGGLGLAIAARAIAMHGGTITASNTDRGLRVEIRLPA